MQLISDFKLHLSRTHKKTTAERGDTIVEVMMALAILAISITVAYVISSHSLNNVTQAEQHSSATEYAQSQVEGLQDLASSTTQDIYTQSQAFCLQGSSGTPTITPEIAGDGTNNCLFGPSNLYAIAVISCYGDSGDAACSGITPSTDTFIVNVTWQGQGDVPINKTTLTYRVHAQ